MKTKITHEVYLAEMYSKVGPTLDSLSGELLSALREKYRPADMKLRQAKKQTE
ncbi:hypothetical protein [Cupriavidus necator]|uniref:hypothetical protein n=1 Tax=Cupriavidus necator TaxID=106590 RepID=UPI0012D342CD|nr:hypothetical protein [Cupriavidus necator]